MLQSIRGYVRAVLDTGPTTRELTRLGITDEILAARAAEIDAATPGFAQTRGKDWAAIGPASKAYLNLLRRLPDNAGADALIVEFHAAAQRGHA